MVPSFRSSVTVSRSITATTVDVAAPRKSSTGENCILPVLRQPLVGTSFQKPFLQGNPMPQLQQTAYKNLPQVNTAEQTAEEYSKDDMVKLIIKL